MARTILLVDDATTARLFIRRCFEIAGMWDATFLEASDGKEALELAKKSDVDLIVTDLNMPNMDGFQFLRRAKSSPRLNPVPVVVVTSLQRESIVEELKEQGATDVLSKPITPAVIMDLLATLPGFAEGEDDPL